jgi:hypothetical protein
MEAADLGGRIFALGNLGLGLHIVIRATRLTIVAVRWFFLR